LQSRKRSALEAVSNVAIGFLVAVAANVVVLPFFGYAVTVSDSFLIGAVFTAVSLVRSYLLRRIFNNFEKRK
jgi:hypothetical protein|tara:strand:- start:486 stop:701 length:216 start_codon:yes stop_codon:yes gene_type:complete